MTFVIVHFNTPELTTCLCSSIRKYHPLDKIIIFDNSNKKPFKNSALFNAEYIDNTKEQIIDFNNEFKKTKLKIDDLIVRINNLGSAKHCFTIDYLIKNLKCDEFCLLDSDILLKKKIDFCNNKYITVGELNKKERNEKNVRKYRILPFIQYFNLKEIKKQNINYFDFSRILGFDAEYTRGYDTGASFYEDVKQKKLKIKSNINLDKYMIHFKGGSWNKQKISFQEWLLNNKSLWK